MTVNNTGKKIVHYVPSEHDYIVVGSSAFVQPLDHPSPYVSNKMTVRTSRVIEVFRDGAGFETENTIYSAQKE